MWTPGPCFICMRFLFKSVHPLLFSNSLTWYHALALAILVLYKKYSEINELLASNNTIDRSLYLRVLFIAVFGSICLVPLGLYSLINSSITASPWPGWKNIHTDISEIILIPVSFWRSDQVSEYQLEIQRWQFVFNAFVIFACFGIHKEARTRYLSALQWLFQCVPCFRVNKCFPSLIICGVWY
jgi:pheromone a factor receptor